MAATAALPAAAGATAASAASNRATPSSGSTSGSRVSSQARVLPTNVVCVYAPRFAEVRVSTGTNQNIDIQTTKTDKTLAKTRAGRFAVESRRLVQNQAAELARARSRASGSRGG